MGKIADDAVVAAEYFKTLLGEGLDVQHAIMLTAQYMSSRLIAESHRGELPPEPWQG